VFERRALLFSCFVDAELRYADAWFPGFAQRPSDYAERLVVVRAAASDAGRDPMAVMPAIWLFVVTGNTRDDVAETLSSDIAKLFALGVSGDVWERQCRIPCSGKPC
jgi:phthiodiolone/phenolphthiodiolone dimycocerosates ketoreductase